MAEIVKARIVGDWRRVIGDEIVSHETTDIGDAGIHGTVTLSPVWARGGPQGVIADPGAHYSIHPVECRVRYGRLYDPTNTHPYEDVVVEIDGQPLVWEAKFNLAYRRRTGEKEVPLTVKAVTFDSSAMVAGQIALTGILPAAAIPDAYKAYFTNAGLSATIADDAKETAVEAAGTATTAKSDAEQAAEQAEQRRAAAAAAAQTATTAAGQAEQYKGAAETAASGAATDRGAIEELRDDLFLAAEQNAAPHLTTAALNATYVSRSTQAKNLLDVVRPSGVDDTAAVNAALAAFAAEGGGTLRIPRAGWKFAGASGLSLTDVSAPIHIEADADVVFDMTGVTAPVGILLGGSSTVASAALGSDAIRGTDTIITTLPVSAGDVIRIQSTDIFDTRLNLPKGELAEVASTSGGVVTLKSGLWDSYAAATTTVTRIRAPRVSVEGLTILRNSNHQGLQVAHARDVLLAGVHARGARERLLYLSNVYGGTVDNCGGEDFWYSDTSTSYGLAVASSQHVIEVGNRFRGGRHAVMHGGTFPCRDIQVIGGTFDNHHPSGTASFDFHANCENVRMVGVTSLNGLTSHASNLDASDCTFHAVNRPAVEAYSPRSCEYVRVRGSDMRSATDHAVHWAPRGGAHTVGLVEFDGVMRGAVSGVYVSPVSSGATGSRITRLSISGDIQSSGSAPGVYIVSNGGTSVAIDSATVAGTVRATGTGRALFTDGPQLGTLRISAELIADSPANGVPATVRGWNDVHVLPGSRLAGASVYRSEFSNTGKLILRGVSIEGGANNGGINALSGPSEALVDNVLVSSDTLGSLGLPARHYSAIDAAGRVTTQGTAAPTAGAWNRGDRSLNILPSAGGPVGWVCTVAGTPGTWKSFGTIAA